MSSTDDQLRFDHDPTRPGALVRHELEPSSECRWCGEVPRRRGKPQPLLVFGWQDEGAPAPRWDRHAFCSEAHYLLFHGGARPR
jgi:hypothetical protein